MLNIVLDASILVYNSNDRVGLAYSNKRLNEFIRYHLTNHHHHVPYLLLIKRHASVNAEVKCTAKLTRVAQVCDQMAAATRGPPPDN